MLKHSSDLVSQEGGDVMEVTKFISGPVQECSNCPCLLVTSDGTDMLGCVRKKGFCAFYMSQLSSDGDYPKKCRVATITIEERV